MSGPFRYFNSSPEVIRLVVMMYVKYPLSLRNVEDLLAERGIDIRSVQGVALPGPPTSTGGATGELGPKPRFFSGSGRQLTSKPAFGLPKRKLAMIFESRARFCHNELAAS
jgi:hypothetical protein